MYRMYKKNLHCKNLKLILRCVCVCVQVCLIFVRSFTSTNSFSLIYLLLGVYQVSEKLRLVGFEAFKSSQEACLEKFILENETSTQKMRFS